MINIEGVSKEFFTKKSKVEILKDISFQCKKGEVFGLLGPNGAGKTTLLRILATIMKPTNGRIEINGIDCVREPLRVRKQIGYLSGETGVYDRFTPREIIHFFGQISGVEKTKLCKRIDIILQEMDLCDYADRRVDRFSTGMKQKVSIARSLIHNPSVIIFDEPTNGLDVIAGRIVKDSIIKLREQEKCIILSTHLMNDVEELCDQVGIIDKGTLIYKGTREKLKSHFNADTLEEIFFKIVGDINEV
ncbi:ABC transporter ATP-binding protein [Alkalibaculum bacchi]|uniref:ABC transporter ATP-binding protein n=1 Tax=Alkalibaculum bacchi TaxID=645887 RepID=UPI0026EF535D|nr:ATP-binding cassette domain-containing protein [Alkalibaculum bacchi]